MRHSRSFLSAIESLNSCITKHMRYLVLISYQFDDVAIVQYVNMAETSYSLVKDIATVGWT